MRDAVLNSELPRLVVASPCRRPPAARAHGPIGDTPHSVNREQLVTLTNPDRFYLDGVQKGVHYGGS